MMDLDLDEWGSACSVRGDNNFCRALAGIDQAGKARPKPGKALHASQPPFDAIGLPPPSCVIGPEHSPNLAMLAEALLSPIACIVLCQWLPDSSAD
jgi:hypothetical protein